MLVDTPGVIPVSEKDPVQLALLASKNPDQLKDPDLVAMNIIKLFMGAGKENILEEHFNFTRDNGDDECDILEKMGVGRGKLAPGGVADIKGISKIIIDEWQKGTLRL